MSSKMWSRTSSCTSAAWVVAVLVQLILGMYFARNALPHACDLPLALTRDLPLDLPLNLPVKNTTHLPLGSAGTSQQQRPEAPYKEYCETVPYLERQLWNMHKKIISYSMFAPSPEDGIPNWLWEGFVLNVEMAKRYYPDWILRIYTFNMDASTVDKLVQYSTTVEVVRCHQDSVLNQLNHARRMLPRFMAIDDPTVRLVIVRDFDSRFSLRELMAVNEWMAADDVEYSFHTMRDHPQHVVPVMGAMFGMKRGLLDRHNTTMTSLVTDAITQFPNKPVSGCCADDQNFLTQFVWPKVKAQAVDHDMSPGRCKRYGSKMCRSYPLGPRMEDKNYFIGAAFKKDEEGPMYYECTTACSMTNKTLQPLE
mmetsp:Transcript_12664/g.24346  ORF Transcript_12664/g.24346 Transcript_12664/m.24346 type:complete len:366 (+) Transcript_12664:74-1171(+)|eukprot:scaffold42595_cov199-Amphora_coffeaeformis.AAC.1